jgi:CheY-like chemotaxis protein
MPMNEQCRRVLVVEDDPVIREVLRDALRDEGLDVREATNGGEALDLLEQWRADVILLDLMMPVMDGWAFREAQSRRPDLRDIPVVVISAKHHVQGAQADLRAAVILPKPFDIDHLLAIINRLIS